MNISTALKACIFLLLIPFKSTSQVSYKDHSLPTETRIKLLIGEMTLDEKIFQLNQYLTGRNNNINNIGDSIHKIPSEIGSLINFSSDPAIRNKIQKKAMEESRLGIPILFGFDVIHGYRTIYPIPLAQSCSWNPELIEKLSSIAAKEAVLSGIDWAFSPMIDVARDPRWGRVSEGYGEDPYATSVFGVATVKGYQGENLSSPYSMAACLKHYVGYGASEGGRDYSYTEISKQSLWETYLPPYEAAVKAGAATLMSGFNDISGVPATANYYTLTEILKNKWNHKGFVVSDWNAVEQLIYQGVAKDKKEAALKAFMAGVEMDMKDNIYLENLKDLVADHLIPIEKIDDAVSRILRVKFNLGLFDDPYTPELPENKRVLQAEDIAFAQKLAEESMVLLKNSDNILPISKTIKNIAIIGPMAKNKADLLGSWSAKGMVDDVESIYEGLEKEFGTTMNLNYAFGCDFEKPTESGFYEAVTIAKNSDIIFLCLGEKKAWSGENASRSSIALPNIQEKLVEELSKTGKPIVLILSSGRPLELVRMEPKVAAIVEIWQPGIAGGSPLAGILSGRINPSGKLSITFPLTTGQIPTYYNMRQNARPFDKMGNYQDISTAPLYWFGHGLSYTTFEYGTVKLSKVKIRKNEKIKAEVTITNTGKTDGKETVFWYISDPAASISRPLKELKHFEKKELKAGETTTFTFEINPMTDLSFPDETGKRILENGDFQLHINNQKVKFELVD